MSLRVPLTFHTRENKSEAVVDTVLWGGSVYVQSPKKQIRRKLPVRNTELEHIHI